MARACASLYEFIYSQVHTTYSMAICYAMSGTDGKQCERLFNENL